MRWKPPKVLEMGHHKNVIDENRIVHFLITQTEAEGEERFPQPPQMIE